MSEKTIYLIRHGETDYNRRKIIQGSGVNSSLNELGRRQAQAFFEAYSHISFDVVLTSALQRTHQTVASWLEQGLLWEQHEHINEISWGDHEGQPSDPALIGVYKRMIADWGEGRFDACLSNGESAAQLSARVETFINHLREREERRILVCSHGRTMRCLMTHFKGQHLREMENYHHTNTGLYLIHYDGNAFEVELENDIRHLQHLRVEP